MVPRPAMPWRGTVCGPARRRELPVSESLLPPRAFRTAGRPDGCQPPAHVAIIMDGNGRWAAKRGLPRLAGHREGAQALRRTIEAAVGSGVPWLTVYAFSSENWGRPATEVSGILGLMSHFLDSELADMDRNGVRLRVIGDTGRFPAAIRKSLAAAGRQTAGNSRINLTVALSYGGRAEILAAARAVAEAALAGSLDLARLDEAGFASLLSTTGIPDPDLVIRTSGEQRLSNFLLWQAAYAELVFLDVLWPDFGADHFAAALAEYARRERRFGVLQDSAAAA